MAGDPPKRRQTAALQREIRRAPPEKGEQGGAQPGKLEGSLTGGASSGPSSEALPLGHLLRRFWLKDNEQVWFDVTGQYVYECFLRIRPKLNGAPFCEVRCEVIPGPVREDASVATRPSPEVVKKVRRRLRAQGVAI